MSKEYISYIYIFIPYHNNWRFDRVIFGDLIEGIKQYENLVSKLHPRARIEEMTFTGQYYKDVYKTYTITRKCEIEEDKLVITDITN